MWSTKNVLKLYVLLGDVNNLYLQNFNMFTFVMVNPYPSEFFRKTMFLNSNYHQDLWFIDFYKDLYNSRWYYTRTEILICGPVIYNNFICVKMWSIRRGHKEFRCEGHLLLFIFVYKSFLFIFMLFICTVNNATQICVT